MQCNFWQARWALVGMCVPAVFACSVGDDESADSFVISAGTPSADGAGDADSEDEVGETGTETAGTGDGDTDTDTDTGTEDTESTEESSTEGSDESTEESTDTGLPELPCAAKFDLIEPNPAIVGQPLTVQFTDDVGHVYIGMGVTQLEGVGSPIAGNETITSDGPNGPYHWTYTITGHGQGIVELSFTVNMQQNVLGTCRVHVVQ